MGCSERGEMVDVDCTSKAASCAPAGPSCGSPCAHVVDAAGAHDVTSAAHTMPTEAGGLTMIEFMMVFKADAAQQEHLVQLISELLQETVARNDSLGRSSALATFEGEKSPVSPGSYVRRIAKYGGCSPCCFVIGLIYLKRLKRRESSVCLTSCNFQRLFIVAVMLAAKFLDDSYYSNKHWAEVGGMTTAELNGLELEFLFRIGFSLALSREEYDNYSNLLAGEETGTEFKTESTVTVMNVQTLASNDSKDGMGDKTPSFCDVSAIVF